MLTCAAAAVVVAPSPPFMSLKLLLLLVLLSLRCSRSTLYCVCAWPAPQGLAGAC